MELPENGFGYFVSNAGDAFVECVLAEDTTTLVKIPGVGKKTAERLVIELRDRLKIGSLRQPPLSVVTVRCNVSKAPALTKIM